MISKFEATGCLDDRPRSGRPSTRRNAAEIWLRDEMETVAGVPSDAIRTKIHRYHELLPGDSVNRRAFAVWAFQKMAEDDDWLSNLLWTDEAHFTLRGSVKTHNCRIWATENPRTVVETPMHDEKVTVWVEFTTSTLIRPFFFEEMRDSGIVTATVTGRLVMIVCSATTFHHAWPPRSPDLNPCDYWFWGYLKSQVHRDRPTSLGDAERQHPTPMLHHNSGHAFYSAVHNIIPRLQLLLRNDGEHTEHFL
ncbi:uncharacterized protein TNCV_4376781 [Trichonephila clavipes]|nr:uncharacterized protein TNCV_4376781 [Trichonephila clavipes]